MTIADWLRSQIKKSTTPKLPTSGGVSVTGGGITGGMRDPYLNTAQPINMQASYLAPMSTTGGKTLGYTTPSGSYSNTSTGGYSEPVDPDAAAKEEAKTDIRNKFGTLQSVFQSLFGEVDNIAREKTSQVDKVYNQGLDTAVNSFGKAQNATNSMYNARGLGDSSYRGSALDENNQVYNTDITNMGLQRENNLAEIGRFAEGTKSQLNASKDAYSPYVNQLDQYGLSDLLSLQTGIGSALSGANQQAATFGTDSEFVQKLGGITPVTSNGTQQLAAKLQNLLTSSAPSQAKKYIAQGLIKAGTLNDASAQSYWNGYFEDLLRSNGMS